MEKMNHSINYKGFDIDVIVNGAGATYNAEVMITPANVAGTAGCARILKFQVVADGNSAFDAMSKATDKAQADIDGWLVTTSF